MTLEWFLVPLVAVTLILGAALMARLERRGVATAVISAVVAVMLGLVLTLLLLFPDALTAWLIGVLVGVGVSYSWFLHRNDAGRRRS